MYHPNSLNYKLQKLLDSNICICSDSKQSTRPFCYGCWRELEDEKGFNTSRLYGSGERFMEAFEEAIRELGYKI